MTKASRWLGGRHDPDAGLLVVRRRRVHLSAFVESAHTSLRAVCADVTLMWNPSTPSHPPPQKTRGRNANISPHTLRPTWLSSDDRRTDPPTVRGTARVPSTGFWQGLVEWGAPKQTLKVLARAVAVQTQPWSPGKRDSGLPRGSAETKAATPGLEACFRFSVIRKKMRMCCLFRPA